MGLADTEIAHEGAGVFRVIDAGAGSQIGVGDHAFEDMAERQETEYPVTGLDGHDDQHRFDIADDILVRQHDAFRDAAGVGGVDDGRHGGVRVTRYLRFRGVFGEEREGFRAFEEPDL
jgi:hypothetical protein